VPCGQFGHRLSSPFTRRQCINVEDSEVVTRQARLGNDELTVSSVPSVLTATYELLMNAQFQSDTDWNTSACSLADTILGDLVLAFDCRQSWQKLNAVKQLKVRKTYGWQSMWLYTFNKHWLPRTTTLKTRKPRRRKETARCRSCSFRFKARRQHSRRVQE